MQQHQGLQPLGCAVGHDPAAVPRAEGETSLLKEKEKQPEVSQAGLMSATEKKGSLFWVYLVHLPVVLLILRGIFGYL